MDIIRFAISNPVKVAVGVILVLLFGLIALVSIPIQLVPNTDPTIITVTTNWVGRSPEEVEKEIIEPQEDVLKNVRNLEKMTATAFRGEAEIELEFKLGTDLQTARVVVSDALREVPSYPEQVDEPVINTGEAGAGSPIAWLLLTTDDPGFDVQTLGDPAEERIKPFLERIEGVSEVRVYGGRAREVHIAFDPQRVAQHEVTLTDLNRALRQQNVNISAGEIAEGRYDTRIRVVGEFDELDEIRRTIVRYTASGPVRIEDLATVELTFEKRRSFVRSRGQTAMAMPVYRESGANVIAVMKEVRSRVRQINRDLLPRLARDFAKEQGLDEAPALRIRQVYDETTYIYDALALVRNNLFIGGTLAGLALLVYLRSVRPTVIVALAIPVSVVGTFVVMYGFGRNINVISLAGLAFAVGMVVDNAIVVLENIDRHLGMGKKPRQAAYDAAKEVWGAILASTLTTLAVFVPVLTIQEEAGQLFRDITLAICAAVSLSLIVSITVIPASSARFLRTHREPKTAFVRSARSLFGLMPIFSGLTRGFSSLIYSLTQRTAAGVFARVCIVGLFTLFSLVGAYLLMPPTDYLPRGNKNLVFGFLIRPPGYSIATDLDTAHRTEDFLRPYWEAKAYEQLEGMPKPIDFQTGEPVNGRVPPIENYFFVSFRGNAFHGAISKDKENVAPLGTLLGYGSTISNPATFGVAEQQSLFGRGASGTRGIEVEVAGSDLDVVRSSADAINNALRERYGQVIPSPLNFNLQSREVEVRIDRVRAADLNLDVATLGTAVQAFVDGAFVGEYRFSGETIDILAMRRKTGDLQPDDLATLPLAYRTDDGQVGRVPLSTVATLRRTQSPQEIRRTEEQRSVKLTATPPDEVPLETATAQIEQMIAQMRDGGQIDPGVQVRLAGSASKLASVREAMLGQWHGWSWASVQSFGFSRIFIALLVTYLLMAALFESFLYPFVIMFSVPLATVGGFLGLAITHAFVPAQQLDTLTMLGFIILIGVVVNNAILIVHQALNFMRGLGEGEGDDTGVLPPREAIRASVRSRVRPIFMTTTTSVAGMLPLVLMPGSGSELYRGLGSVVVGGLIVATLFTLIVVPLLLSLAMDAKIGFYRLMGWASEELSLAEGHKPAAAG